MLADAIYSLLNPVNANTYPGVIEQEVEPPFIVHSLSRTIPYPSKSGASTMDVCIYKVASYAVDPKAAQTQANSIRVILDEYTGVKNSVDIDNIRFVDEENGFDLPVNLFYVLQTYKIWINFNT